MFNPSVLRIYNLRDDCKLSSYHVSEWLIHSGGVFYDVRKDDLPVALFGMKDGETMFALSALELIEPRRHLEVRYHHE